MKSILLTILLAISVGACAPLETYSNVRDINDSKVEVMETSMCSTISAIALNRRYAGNTELIKAHNAYCAEVRKAFPVVGQ